MWTRVKAFIHRRAAIRAAVNIHAADIEAVRESVLALSAKLTAQQTRLRIIENSICALDDLVAQLGAERYPHTAKANAARAAERVREGLRARGVIPVVPAIAEGEKLPMKPDYATGPGIDNDAPPPGNEDTPIESTPNERPADAIIDSPYPWARDRGPSPAEWDSPDVPDDPTASDCEVESYPGIGEDGKPFEYVEHANHCDGNCTSPPCR